jgi:hypothetical protein
MTVAPAKSASQAIRLGSCRMVCHMVRDRPRGQNHPDECPPGRCTARGPPCLAPNSDPLIAGRSTCAATLQSYIQGLGERTSQTKPQVMLMSTGFRNTSNLLSWLRYPGPPVCLLQPKAFVKLFRLGHRHQRRILGPPCDHAIDMPP